MVVFVKQFKGTPVANNLIGMRYKFVWQHDLECCVGIGGEVGEFGVELW